MPEIVSLKVAGGKLGISYSLLREWAKEGRIPATRTSGDRGRWLVNVSKVEEALKAQMTCKGEHHG